MHTCMRLAVALGGAILVPLVACAQTQTSGALPFRDPSLSFEARARDIVGRLTLEEKAEQMKDARPRSRASAFRSTTGGTRRCTASRARGARPSFPQAIGLAATWNDSLMFRIATVISDEARAKHHEYDRAREPRALPGADVLVPEHQPVPRSALGTRAGDLRRRSVAHRAAGGAIHSRAPGRRPQVLQDRRHGETLRRAQRAGARAARVRRGRERT